VTIAPRPGWYPDPAGSDELFRWWDGRFWTDAISESDQSPAPVSLLSAGVAFDPDARKSSSAVKKLLVLTAGFAVFVAAGLGVGLVIWREPNSSNGPQRGIPLNTLSPVAPGVHSVPAAPAGRLDETTGVATIGPASLTLPGPPYDLYEDPMQVSGVFDTFFLADADVHDDFDGKHGWSAIVGLAHLTPALTQSSHLEQVGSAALLRMSRFFFNGHPTSFRRVTYSDRSVDGHSGVRVTMEVHYAIKQLPSRYDTVTMLLVRLDDGSMVAAVSTVPNDADPELQRLARQSVESLTVS
jgi:hypothetical protein